MPLRRSAAERGGGGDSPPPRDAAREDPDDVLALLEAIGGGESSEIFQRAIEKDLRELIVRFRRLRAELALTPDVADPIVAQALARAGARVDESDDVTSNAPRPDA